MSIDMLATQFNFTYFVLRKNCADLSHEESLRTPRPTGNCMNWVLGHILVARDGMLKTLGEGPVLTDEQAVPYRRGAMPLTLEVAQEWGWLLSTLDTTQERLTAALAKLDADRLQEMVPAAIGGGEEPLSQFLASLAFHEAYHAGQTGVLRRVAGKAGAIQ